MSLTNYAYVNGRFVPEEQATVSIFDRGFLYGDGVFETMRVYGGKVFRLNEHLHRLCAGLTRLKIGAPLSEEQLRALCEELIDRNGLANGMARIAITRGAGGIGLSMREKQPQTVVALAQPREFPLWSPGVRVITSAARLDADSPLADVKSAGRLPYILAKLEAEQEGGDDAVLFNTHGSAMELTASNLFTVKNGELFTPPLSDGPLPGVTRKAVLALAEELQIATYETSCGTEFMADADEMFATNSITEVAPVISLDGSPFTHHTVTERLREAYRKLVAEELKTSVP